MKYAPILTKIMEKIVDVYEANVKTKSRKRALFLKNVSLISEIALIGGVILYMGCVILHLIVPIYAYYWQNKSQPLFPLYIPFIDEKTVDGFILLTSIQTIEISLAAVCCACTDVLFLLLIINVPIFTFIFEENVNELTQLLQKKKVQNMPLAKAKLQNIFVMYNEIWM